ncbi:MAG: hypothetical protein AB7F25_02765 [Deferribacterales bacterium]
MNETMKESIKDFENLLTIMKGFTDGTRNVKILDNSQTLQIKYNEEEKEVVIGFEGFDLLKKIFDRHLNKKYRFAYEKYDKYILYMGNLFLENYFIKESEINAGLVSNVVSSTNTLLEKDYKSYSIYIPLIFFKIEKNEEIKYGPITIYSIENTKITFLQDFLELKANKLFKSIAQIEVKALSLEFARTRSLQLLKAFLGLCSILPDCNSPEYLRTYFDDYPKYFQHFFYSDGRQSVEKEKKIEFISTECPKWQNHLGGQTSYPHVIAEILTKLSKNNFIDFLGLRIFDSLVMYHDAVIENNLFYKIPKLFTVIERLIHTESQSNRVTANITERKEYLFKILEESKILNDINFSKLYDLRSDIIHGSHSMIKPIPTKDVKDINEITKNLIKVCTCFYFQNGINETVNDKEIDFLFNKLISFIKNRDSIK